jgi:L-ascorbate metabolism protein UlaG (beta-lactamase superfamily)
MEHVNKNRSSLKPALVAGLAAATTLVRPVTGATRGLRRSMAADAPFSRRSVHESPQFRDGVFHNRLPSEVAVSTSQGSMALEFARKGDRGRPAGAVPVMTPELPETAGDLAATWMGHATVLLEIAGHWVLIDPVWSDRVSPSPTIGPKRSHPLPMPLEDLPAVTAVLISHDHYDHLDTATIDALTELQPDLVFVVPLGIGSHMRLWGVPEDRIVELDWDESTTLSVDGLPDLVLTCTEARHFSGRGLTRNNTLWATWSMVAGTGRARRSVFFGGDTGYTPAFADIGAALGPFDLTILPIGAYDDRWSDIHINPAEAVQMHRDVRGGVMLPIHWATFDLAFHTWSAPIEWAVEEAAEFSVDLACPRPGERFEVGGVLPTAAWWAPLSRENTGRRFAS